MLLHLHRCLKCDSLSSCVSLGVTRAEEWCSARGFMVEGLEVASLQGHVCETVCRRHLCKLWGKWIWRCLDWCSIQTRMQPLWCYFSGTFKPILHRQVEVFNKEHEPFSALNVYDWINTDFHFQFLNSPGHIVSSINKTIEQNMLDIAFCHDHNIWSGQHWRQRRRES